MAASSSKSTANQLSRATVAYILSDEARWDILAELASGEGRMVIDLSDRIGRSPNSTTKHLKVLRDVGIVMSRYRLHFLVERFRPAPGVHEIDFGHCVIRLKR
jgi:DNA-binding transcriptional ArsR family regulator